MPAKRCVGVAKVSEIETLRSLRRIFFADACRETARDSFEGVVLDHMCEKGGI